ncbi:hypothetical protein BHYA_0219g00150 [Botrytis hyacinthi]|uniref:Uncharacterized protein n=1 Tax=Botrytis hyacinthi TaxID=278943 RepID=A0A4Z1GD22_9HELO|nr:hypothetical protein BHYA_0219g00150 [Botrytis hyacinthi]
MTLNRASQWIVKQHQAVQQNSKALRNIVQLWLLESPEPYRPQLGQALMKKSAQNAPESRAPPPKKNLKRVKITSENEKLKEEKEKRPELNHAP